MTPTSRQFTLVSSKLRVTVYVIAKGVVLFLKVGVTTDSLDITTKLLYTLLSNFLRSSSSLVTVFLLIIALIFTFSVSIVVGALVAATLTSLVHNTGVTRLGSLSEVDLIQSILADYSPVTAHSSAITPAALLASSTTTSSTRKERLLIIIEDILIVAGNTVKFTDSRLAASILSKSFIACLIVSKVVNLDVAQEKYWCAKE